VCFWYGCGETGCCTVLQVLAKSKGTVPNTVSALPSSRQKPGHNPLKKTSLRMIGGARFAYDVGTTCTRSKMPSLTWPCSAPKSIGSGINHPIRFGWGTTGPYRLSAHAEMRLAGPKASRDNEKRGTDRLNRDRPRQKEAFCLILGPELNCKSAVYADENFSDDFCCLNSSFLSTF
jgi:hypothetical protein